MVGAFAYLTITSARNRFAGQLRRLRNPRYVIALLLAGLYFYFILIRPGRSQAAPGQIFLGDAMQLVYALVLVGLTTYWWLLGSDSTALAFSPAELHFLFPAPVTRRQLIQFKLVRSQVVILFNILIWTLLLRRGGADGTMMLLRPLSLWVLFSTLQLHRVGAALTRTSVSDHGGAGARRSGVAVVVMTLVIGALLFGLVRAWPAHGVDGLMDGVRLVQRGVADAPARWALFPFRLIIAPLFTTTVEAWVGAIAAATAVMLLHFLWVVRADAAFEDAAIEASAERAARLDAWRSGGRMARRRRSATEMLVSRSRLRLAPVGEPAIALLWKNVLAAVRGDRVVRQLIVFGGMVLVLCIFAVVRPQRGASFVFGLITSFGAMLVVLGPIWLRNDLRGDLPRLELLRTYPIPPARFVAAELASSALVLTVLEYALGVCVFIALLRSPDVKVPILDRAAVLAAAVVALPALNLLTATLHNGAALLFPAWVTLGATRRPGFEAMGQTYLTMLVSLVGLALLLVVPVLVGGGIGIVFWRTYRMWALVPAAAAGAAVAVGELALLLRWLGRVFERTEPADVAVPA